LSTDLLLEWPLWRLVTGKIATLSEIEASWSFDDVVRANALLDYQQSAADMEMEDAKRAGQGTHN